MAEDSFMYDEDWDEDVFYGEASQQAEAGLIGFEVRHQATNAKGNLFDHVQK